MVQTVPSESARVPAPLPEQPAALSEQPAIAPPVPGLSPYAMPAFIARARRGSESVQWAIFGGTAGFLGVVWVAIWLSTGGQ